MSTTAQQRRSALERANEVRFARAELRRRIARGEIFAASVLLDPPDEARNWRVLDMLLAQRRWGIKRVRRLLRVNFIPEAKSVGGLTERQRSELAAALERQVPWRIPADWLPAGPFAAWLEDLYAQLGTWARVGEALGGVDESTARRWAHAERISAQAMKRSVESAGTTLEAIGYGA